MVGPGIARYDGHAEWYDETFSASLNEEEESFLLECLRPSGAAGGGQNPGQAGAETGEPCLDVACGAGRYARVLAEAGYAAGLGALVGAAGRAAAHGGSLRVVCGRARIRRLFGLTGLDRAVPLAGSLTEALQDELRRLA